MKYFATLLIAISVFTFSLAGYKLFMVYTHPLKYEKEIIFYSNKYNLSPELVASVINVESSFKKNAESNKGALGLMQIKLDTANYLDNINNRNNLSKEELLNPKINIKYGCEYLKYLIDKFENQNTALAAYNAGETKVRSWLNSGIMSIDGKTLTYIPYKETRNYLNKINTDIKYYKNLF